MPFWSRKGKERATNQTENDDNDPKPSIGYELDDETSELVQHHGYRLPEDLLNKHKARWWKEKERREEIQIDIEEFEAEDDEDEDSDNEVEPYNPCSAISLTTEEAYREAELMWSEADTVHWTKDEIRNYNSESFATTAYVRKRLEEESATAHARCCKRKAGIDQRLDWAIRNLVTYDGKQLLEDLKMEQKKSSASDDLGSAALMEAAPPSYAEASGPPYIDINSERPKEKET